MIKLLDSTVACLSMSALVKIAMVMMMTMNMMRVMAMTMMTITTVMTMIMKAVLQKLKNHTSVVCALLVNSN